MHFSNIGRIWRNILTPPSPPDRVDLAFAGVIVLVLVLILTLADWSTPTLSGARTLPPHWSLSIHVGGNDASGAPHRLDVAMNNADCGLDWECCHATVTFDGEEDPETNTAYCGLFASDLRVLTLHERGADPPPLLTANFVGEFAAGTRFNTFYRRRFGSEPSEYSTSTSFEDDP